MTRTYSHNAYPISRKAFRSNVKPIESLHNVDWQRFKSAFDRITQQHSVHGKDDVKLSTDGVPQPKGNSQFVRFRSSVHDAFNSYWLETSFCDNPVYTADFITWTLLKTISDFSKNPSNTLFVFVPLKWQTEQHCPYVSQSGIITTYPADSRIFAWPASTTFITTQLDPVSDKGRPGSSFVEGTPWEDIGVVKNCFVYPQLNHVKLLPARLGHLAPSTMLPAGVENGTNTKLSDEQHHLPPGSCSACTQTKRRSFHAQDQSCM